jgi:hypothetical protein
MIKVLIFSRKQIASVFINQGGRQAMGGSSAAIQFFQFFSALLDGFEPKPEF